jgi:hypothetical protein
MSYFCVTGVVAVKREKMMSVVEAGLYPGHSRVPGWHASDTDTLTILFI